MAINCLEGLIDLIIGNVSVLSDEVKKEALARHMVQQSYFFTKEDVDRRHEEIKNMLTNLTEKVPVRYSTRQDSPYYDESRQQRSFDSKNQAASVTSSEMIYYKLNEKYIPVVVDTDGNRAVRRLINSVTGKVIAQGAASDFKYAVISHIWGNASNPLFFTNLWNLVVVPTYLNPILDKNAEDAAEMATFYNSAVSYVNMYFRKLCYEKYDLRSKINEYNEILGFDCSGYFGNIDNDLNVHVEDVAESHYLKRDDGSAPVRRTVTRNPALQNQAEGEARSQNIKIGELVKTRFYALLRSGTLSEEELQNLQNVEYSRRTFDIRNKRFPVLRPTSLGRNDEKGHPRYYATVFCVGGNTYYVTNDWYEYNKRSLLQYLAAHNA